MNASHARKSFAGVLESVMRDGKPVLIIRYRQPIAAIVPISRLSPKERTLSKSRAAARRRR